MISRDKAPTAQETFMQMAQAAGLRSRLFVTIGILILARLGVFLPVPGINREQFAQSIQGNNPLFGLLNIFSGGGLSTLGIFALGILRLPSWTNTIPTIITRKTSSRITTPPTASLPPV